MNAQELFSDLETGALVEVKEEACSYFDSCRGLTVNQRFFVYPNDTIVCLNSVDGGYSVAILGGDNEVIFRDRNPRFFCRRAA